MPGNSPSNSAIARNLISHIRCCCTALVDGTVRLPRRKPILWLALADSSAKYWRYPIITPAVRDDCAALGINLDDEIQHLSGVCQLQALLRTVQEPLTDFLSQLPATGHTLSVDMDFESCAYVRSRVRGLLDLFAPVQMQDMPGISLCLHGSMADLRYTYSSDVDVVVILRRTAWQDPEALTNAATLLARIARGYQDVDPLQHHGHRVLTEFDLLFYDQSHLPLVVLDEAVRISGESRVNCRICQDDSGFIRNAVNTIRSVDKTLRKVASNGGLNAFELKGLVGEIAILPAYLFQAQGELISKREAISRADEMYSPRALQALEWATLVRNEFEPLIRNRRTKVIRTVARLTCARRQHAESLFRNHAVWVDNQHPLGLSVEVAETLEVFIRESGSVAVEMMG